MGSINPTTGMAVFIVIAALLGVVSTVIRTVYTVRRSPPPGEDHATIRAEVIAIKETLREKQGAQLCATVHRQMDDTLRDVRTRHSAHENKISRQIADTHNRIDRQTTAIAANGAKLETFMDEIRNWRNNHHA